MSREKETNEAIEQDLKRRTRSSRGRGGSLVGPFDVDPMRKPRRKTQDAESGGADRDGQLGTFLNNEDPQREGSHFPAAMKTSSDDPLLQHPPTLSRRQRADSRELYSTRLTRENLRYPPLPLEPIRQEKVESPEPCLARQRQKKAGSPKPQPSYRGRPEEMYSPAEDLLSSSDLSACNEVCSSPDSSPTRSRRRQKPNQQRSTYGSTTRRDIHTVSHEPSCSRQRSRSSRPARKTVTLKPPIPTAQTDTETDEMLEDPSPPRPRTPKPSVDGDRERVTENPRHRSGATSCAQQGAPKQPPHNAAPVAASEEDYVMGGIPTPVPAIARKRRADNDGSSRTRKQRRFLSPYGATQRDNEAGQMENLINGVQVVTGETFFGRHIRLYELPKIGNMCGDLSWYLKQSWMPTQISENGLGIEGRATFPLEVSQTQNAIIKIRGDFSDQRAVATMIAWARTKDLPLMLAVRGSQIIALWRQVAHPRSTFVMEL